MSSRPRVSGTGVGKAISKGAWAGPVAALVWILAVASFGARLEGYDQLQHPVSLLGATGVAGAAGFGLLGFVVPGLLAIVAAVQLLLRLPPTAPRTMRIGGQMLLLAGVAHAAMGVFPLDAANIENAASQWHASAWLLWLVAFSAGAVLMWVGAFSTPRWRPAMTLALVCAVFSVCCAFVFPAVMPAVMPAAMAQRLAFAGWLLWLAVGPFVWPDRDR